MKSVELTAYAVREYDVKYTIVLDETDPLIKKFLSDNEITIEQISATYESHQELWNEIMSSELNIKIEEDFCMSDEMYTTFEAFVSESE